MNHHPWLASSLVLTLACSSGTTNTDKDTDTDQGILPTETFRVDDTAGGDPGGTPGGTPGGVDTDTDVTVIEECTRPAENGLQYVCNLSVNGASIERPTASGDPLFMTIEQTAPNPMGGFIGAGTGNRAIAGFHGYNRVALSTIEAFSYDVERVIGVASVELELLVDLTCDGEFVLIKARASDLAAPLEVDGHERFRLPRSAAIWSAVGGLENPGAPGENLLDDPVAAIRTPRSLDGVLSVYPDACLRNFDLTRASDPTPFGSLPRGRVSSSVMLTLGSATTTNQPSTWEVYRFAIDDDVHGVIP